MFAVFHKEDSSNTPISPVYGNFSTAFEFKGYMHPLVQELHIIKQLCGLAGWCDCEKECVICGEVSHKLLCSMPCYEIYKERNDDKSRKK